MNDLTMIEGTLLELDGLLETAGLEAARVPAALEAIKRLRLLVDLNDLLDVKQVSELTGLSLFTVREWPRLRDRPQPVRRFGTAPVWLRQDVEAWMANLPSGSGAPGKPRNGVRCCDA